MLAECTVPMQARCLSHVPMYLFKKPRRAWHETIPVCVLYISIAVCKLVVFGDIIIRGTYIY